MLLTNACNSWKLLPNNYINIQQQIQPLKQSFEQLNENTAKHLEEFHHSIALLQTELQKLTSASSQLPTQTNKDFKFSLDSEAAKVFLPAVTSPLSQPTIIQKFHSLSTLQGHSHQVVSIAFTRDGQTLASGSHDRTIKIWHLISQEPRTISVSTKVNAVAFHPSGNILAAGTDDPNIKLWNVATKEEIGNLTGHKQKVYSVVFSPNGKILASGSQDKTIKLWYIQKQQETYTLTGHTDEVLCVAFSPDGKILASGSGDGDRTIKIWYLTQNKFLTLKEDSRSWGRIYAVAFSPDGKFLASASQDKIIRLWNVENGKEIRTFLGHTEEVYCLAFSPDGKILASGSQDKTVKLWKVETGDVVRTFTENQSAVYSVTFSPDGKKLATANENQTIMLLPCR
jgi:WD40 repeat protein